MQGIERERKREAEGEERAFRGRRTWREPFFQFGGFTRTTNSPKNRNSDNDERELRRPRRWPKTAHHLLLSFPLFSVPFVCSLSSPILATTNSRGEEEEEFAMETGKTLLFSAPYIFLTEFLHPFVVCSVPNVYYQRNLKRKITDETIGTRRNQRRE